MNKTGFAFQTHSGYDLSIHFIEFSEVQFMKKHTLSMSSIHTYRYQCTLCTGVIGQAALVT